MKDNFSAGAEGYVQYRPSYPNTIFTWLQTLLPGTENAWDCATGNGQAAQKLASFFSHVYATDISEAQLDNAVRLPNIHYSQQPAEKTNFSDDFFDLVMVAQAVHWFNFDQFYAEVARTARAGGLVVVIGYGRLRVTPEVDAVLDNFYFNIVGPYWDKERRYIDEHYQTIPFPFEELPVPAFSNTCEWTQEQLLGYLRTWSAVKHYQKQNGSDPVELIAGELRLCWGTIEKRVVHFPLLLRVGRV